MIVAVVDPGSGNLNSVARALTRAGELAGLAPEIRITRDAEQVRLADRVVLPGQGAFAACRSGLADLPGMTEALAEVGLRRARPFLGICVGMQLLAERGLEHGPVDGLAWLPGEITPMDPRDESGAPLPLPQMGWNRLRPNAGHPLLAGLPDEPYGYFVHSFAWSGADPADILATAVYGGEVTAMIGRGNLAGTQFHVEKSGMTGLSILRNFLAWTP